MALTFKNENDIGIIEFDHDDSKVNLLTSEVIKQLSAILDEVAKRSDLAVVIFRSKKKDVFIAGADIKEIEQFTDPKDAASKAKAGQDVLNKIEDLKVPTVAVIDGVALGGGCELALACLYRVGTFNEKLRIGLPEVNLGFVPGFGGTYRLPRVVGLAEGLKLILSGRPINASQALKNGLFDRLFSQRGLNEQVMDFVNDIKSGKIKKRRYERKKKKGIQGFIEESRVGHVLIFNQSQKSVLSATKGFYPAPLKALEVVQKNYYMNRPQGLAIEAQAFGQLAVTSISKNLVQVFYISEKYKKLSLEGAEDVKPRKIERSAVLGAGIMGGGIAQLFSARGIWTRLKDINHDAIAKGFAAARKIYEGEVKKRRLNKAEAEGKMAHITGTLDYSGFSSADLVVEAVVENMDIKKKVFKELSEVVNFNCILATNTSALSVTEMAKVIKDPSKVIGIHFFNPVHRMPLIEVITTPMTSKETIVTTLNLVKQVGKTPILCKDAPGFVVNRILLAYINEAGRILEETGKMEEVDKVMTDFGMPMGPFTLSDEVGLDVGIKVLHILEAGLGERYKPAQIFDKVFDKKMLGKKSGKGFYIHARERIPNAEIHSMLPTIKRPFQNKECLNRLVLIMINEAAMILEDQVVTDPAAIDIGMIFGTGFPAFRGGLLKYADAIGQEKLIQEMNELNKKLTTNRFTPSKYLANLKNKKFYNGI